MGQCRQEMFAWSYLTHYKQKTAHSATCCLGGCLLFYQDCATIKAVSILEQGESGEHNHVKVRILYKTIKFFNIKLAHPSIYRPDMLEKGKSHL
ncbi:hypothetical protein AMECASPLE_017892 [Ameca splendens]|uniref:Uncharacterized protein n=1 Tax=Ameca splendens TaxID=208324 RepID=A0ABV0Z0M9_9TELE